MVSDKAQVRATGPINNLTRQPVKGRKHHGGIRFGEMERWVPAHGVWCCFAALHVYAHPPLVPWCRDSLLSHGSAYLLCDRLLNCSDRHIALVCRNCGSLLSTSTRRATIASTASASVALASTKHHCLACDTGDHVVSMALPYVFRYLANELAAMNIRLTLNVGTPGFAEASAASAQVVEQEA